MKKFLSILAISAIFAPAIFAETQSDAAPAPETQNVVQLKGTHGVSESDPQVVEIKKSTKFEERVKQITQEIPDELTRARVHGLLTQSNSILKLLHISEDFFDGESLGISNYAIASTIALFVIYGFAAILIVKLILFAAFKFSKTKRLNTLAAAITAVNSPLSKIIYANAFYISFWRCAFALNFSAKYDAVFTIIFTCLFAWLVLRVFDIVAGGGEFYLSKRAGMREIISVFRKIMRWVIIISAALILASRFSLNVSGFMVSLGIGGAALAFASKDTIANFFGSISIIMDASFKIGDRIQVAGKLDGFVESIGIRSTRIRNLDNTISILPNSTLATEYIVNVSQWKKRRFDTIIGLVYSTTPEQMRAILRDIRRMLSEDEGIADDGIYVTFKEFGESSLNIYITFFTKSVDTVQFNENIERINLAIIDIVAKNKTEMAFPTRTVYHIAQSDSAPKQ